MAATELWGSREITEEPRARTARRRFVAEYDRWRQDVPKLGDPYPGDNRLVARRRTMRPMSPDRNGTNPAQYVEVEVEYSTLPYLDSEPIEEWRVSAESLSVGPGRWWVGANWPCEQPLNIIIPLVEWELQLLMATVPRAAIVANVGKVNGYDWEGWQRGTLLFVGANIQSRWDYDRNRYLYTVRLQFQGRPVPWNVVWRAPRQKRVDGVLLYDNLGQPVYVDGPAGVGGWDTTDPPLYAEGDFDPLVGRPPRYI
jgi:hypothetical protein